MCSKATPSHHGRDAVLMWVITKYEPRYFVTTFFFCCPVNNVFSGVNTESSRAITQSDQREWTIPATKRICASATSIDDRCIRTEDKTFHTPGTHAVYRYTSAANGRQPSVLTCLRCSASQPASASKQHKASPNRSPSHTAWHLL